MNNLTLQEQATNFETMRHIEKVRNYLNVMVSELLKRAQYHDQSKLQQPEVGLFTEYTTKLAECTYGSEEYNNYKLAMKPALDHHYANNRHHPEHWKDGIDDMNLIDLIEMLVDWKAASERHNDGNIRRSIEINKDRFNMSSQLCRIFENTVDLL